jgi:hypothetical protein
MASKLFVRRGVSSWCFVALHVFQMVGDDGSQLVVTIKAMTINSIPMGGSGVVCQVAGEAPDNGSEGERRLGTRQKQERQNPSTDTVLTTCGTMLKTIAYAGGSMESLQPSPSWLSLCCSLSHPLTHTYSLQQDADENEPRATNTQGRFCRMTCPGEAQHLAGDIHSLSPLFTIYNCKETYLSSPETLLPPPFVIKGNSQR